MRVVYYTTPAYLDCDLPYLKEQNKNIPDLYTIINIPPYFLRSTLINISEQYSTPGIYKASIYKELVYFKDYLNLEKTFVVNRTSKKSLAFSNLILDIKIFFLFIKLKPDVIHSSSFYDFQNLLLYYFRKKTFLTVHDPFPHTGEDGFRVKFFSGLSYKLLDNFFILNEKQKSQFITTYKLEKKNVYESKLGVYTVYNLYVSEQLKKTTCNYILFFGRISPYKGVNILLDAMKNVHETFPEIKLIVAGNGKYYFDKTEFEKLDYIEFRNRYKPNDELVNLIKDALFIVCPYTDATQSGVIMTSYAFCKPVIATNVGGLSDMVTDHITGLLIQTGNVIELQKAIAYLLVNQQLLNEMKQNIFKQFFQGDNTWISITANVLAVYKQMIKCKI